MTDDFVDNQNRRKDQIIFIWLIHSINNLSTILLLNLNKEEAIHRFWDPYTKQISMLFSPLVWGTKQTCKIKYKLLVVISGE